MFCDCFSKRKIAPWEIASRMITPTPTQTLTLTQGGFIWGQSSTDQFSGRGLSHIFLYDFFAKKLKASLEA